jgi:hypothetical protein
VGIWVRSQDKELMVETSRIELLNVAGTKIGFFEGEHNTLLGEYVSKEESLAVLDEIQNGIMRFSKDREHVYYMPPNGFLKEKASAQS